MLPTFDKSWTRHLPLLILLILDGWLMFNFSIVQDYPIKPAGTAFWIALLLSLFISAYYLTASPGFLFNRRSSDTSTRGNGIEGDTPSTHVLVKVLAGITFLASGFIWMLLMYRLDGFQLTTDTFAYARVAEQPLTTSAFWFSERPFTLPLLFKLFRIDTQVLNDPAFLVSIRVKQFTQFQALSSLAAFILLGMAATTHMRRQGLKALILTLTLAFAMAIDIAQWNRMLIADSITLSLLALLLSAWLLSLHSLRTWDTTSPWLRRLIPLVLILLTALFSFTRDTSAFFVLLMSGAILLYLLITHRRHKASRALLLIALISGAVSMLQITTWEQNDRWLFPLANIVSRRVLTDREATAFFIEQGAPFETIPSDQLPVNCSGDCSDMHAFLRKDPFGQELLNWYRDQGLAAYLRLLLAKPLSFIKQPLADMQFLLSPDPSPYRLRVYPDPTWLRTARRLVLPQSVVLSLLWAVAALIGALLLRQRGSHGHLLIPAGFLLLSFGLMFVIWHNDSIELARRAAQNSLQFKLSLWLLTAFVVDGILARQTIKLRRSTHPMPGNQSK